VNLEIILGFSGYVFILQIGTANRRVRCCSAQDRMQRVETARGGTAESKKQG